MSGREEKRGRERVGDTDSVKGSKSEEKRITTTKKLSAKNQRARERNFCTPKKLLFVFVFILALSPCVVKV